MKWFDVKDKVPEDGQSCLVIGKNRSSENRMSDAIYSNKYIDPYFDFPFCNCCDDNWFTVTHWMPMRNKPD